MSNNYMSIADRFVEVMAQVNQMDADIPDFAVERVWTLKDAATAAIRDGLFAAGRCIDLARIICQTENDARQEEVERINRIETALRLVAEAPHIDRARSIAEEALKQEVGK